jgi:hypothetical protein
MAKKNRQMVAMMRALGRKIAGLRWFIVNGMR